MIKAMQPQSVTNIFSKKMLRERNLDLSCGSGSRDGGGDGWGGGRLSHLGRRMV